VSQPTIEPRTRRPIWLILCLAFTSGFIIMSVELLGGRILAPYFGSSIYVWGSIITIFMMALSVGYLIGGRLSLHQPSLFRYGLFFIIAAIALTPVIVFANAWMDAVFVRIEDPRYGSLVASTVLFFIPTAILGMIAPYSVRLVVESTTTSGQVAGALYFVSTLGSALGTLMTSFYLVLWFDMNTIISVMIAALLIAGVAAMAADRFFPIEDIGNQTVTNPMEANA
jgi:MFS family permease